MRSSVLGTGHRLGIPTWLRARGSKSDDLTISAASQTGNPRACMHCMHKNRLNFSDLCVIMHVEFSLAGWLAGWLAAGWLAAAVARDGARILRMRARML